MVERDNPAVRLHAVLTEYRRQANHNKSILTTWQDTLGGDPSEIRLRLGDVASLLPATVRAVAATGDRFQAGVVSHFSDKWSHPILLPSGREVTTTPSPGPGLVDPDALVALGGVASFLFATGSSGVIPTDDALSAAREHVDEALALLLSAEDLPITVKQDLMGRLHDLLWAIDNIGLTGTLPVTAAMERFAGVVAINGPTTKKSPTIKKVLGVVGIVWYIFTSAPQVENAIESWSNLASITSTDTPEPDDLAPDTPDQTR